MFVVSVSFIQKTTRETQDFNFKFEESNAATAKFNDVVKTAPIMFDNDIYCINLWELAEDYSDLMASFGVGDKVPTYY